MSRRYFAYGSNLCAEQMAERCPAAREGELVALSGWRFIINRHGVATLVPDPVGQVWGLLWHLTSACERALDRYEGVAKGVYRKEDISVGAEPALIYLATEDRAGPPREGYLQRILAACVARGVDPAYWGGLEHWAGAAHHLPSAGTIQSMARPVQPHRTSQSMRADPLRSQHSTTVSLPDTDLP